MNKMLGATALIVAGVACGGIGLAAGTALGADSVEGRMTGYDFPHGGGCNATVTREIFFATDTHPTVVRSVDGISYLLAGPGCTTDDIRAFNAAARSSGFDQRVCREEFDGMGQHIGAPETCDDVIAEG